MFEMSITCDLYNSLNYFLLHTKSQKLQWIAMKAHSIEASEMLIAPIIKEMEHNLPAGMLQYWNMSSNSECLYMVRGR